MVVTFEERTYVEIAGRAEWRRSDRIFKSKSDEFTDESGDDSGSIPRSRSRVIYFDLPQKFRTLALKSHRGCALYYVILDHSLATYVYRCFRTSRLQFT